MLETKYQREKQFPKDYVFYSHSASAHKMHHLWDMHTRQINE